MTERGCVILVGAGPGDPGLLTLAGKEALETADVILHDRLAGAELLLLARPDALLVDVGKNKGSHPVPQHEINRLLAQHAREGKKVVRLKGGDPFLFGRGGEELEFLATEKIPFRMVPGVTSAIAAPGCAGIPVTHRDLSSSLHIVTGHGRDDRPPNIPYEALVRAGGTMVFLMALSAVEEICAGLSASGLSSETPAALVENGTRADQRRVTGTLSSLPALAASESVTSPAVLVVGAVCGLANTLDWSHRLPLKGRRVLVVSSRTTGSRLGALLREQGCGVDEFAGIRIHAIPDSAKQRQPDSRSYSWIAFTSSTGVELFFKNLFAAGRDARSLSGIRFAVVGSGTGDALRARGICPDYMPDEFDGHALGDGLAARAAPGETVLLYRAAAGGEGLPDALRAGSVQFEDFPAYETSPARPDDATRRRLLEGEYDAVTFTSASAVRALGDAFAGENVRIPPTFCIGEKTAAAARQYGMSVTTSREATIESLADTLVKVLGKK